MFDNKIYLRDETASNSGTIITNVVKTDGLNNQYRTPRENINIQNSFLYKNFIIF